MEHLLDSCPERSPIALAPGEDCTCASAPRNETRLYRWLLLSLLLHSSLTLLFMLRQESKARQEASIIFAQPDPPQSQTHMMPASQESMPPMPPAAPAEEPPPPMPATPQDEEVQFNLNLNQNSKFGMPELTADEFVPQGEENKQEEATETEPPQESQAEQAEATEAAHEQPKQEPVERVVNADPSPTALVSDEKKDMAEAQHEEKTTELAKNPFEGKKKSAGPISKNLSLAKLTEGFLDFVKERGPQEQLTLHSNDVRYSSYFQKVGWFLQNSFHLHNRPITLDYNVNETIDLHMIIDKAGKLASCTIRQPCSAPAINNLLRKIVESAAPFPPLPAHLKKDRLSVSIPINIMAHPGTHLYHFTFRG